MAALTPTIDPRLVKSFGITSPFFAKVMENFDLARGKGDISFFKGLDVSGRDWDILGGTGIFWEGIIMDDVYAMLF